VDGFEDNRVRVIPLPYEPLYGEHWNNVQRMAFTLGRQLTNGTWTGVFDVDEFVAGRDLKKVLQENIYAPAICSDSVLVTNKERDRQFDNDVLVHAIFTNDSPKYTKVFIREQCDFVSTPHDFPGALKLAKNDMYHGHFWLNDRLAYLADSFREINAFC
jgi:hypothetical protein